MSAREPTDMELRVAKALWLDAGGTRIPHDDGSKTVGDYISRARVAIRAMRGDPGHDVTAAVVFPTCDRSPAVKMWEQMIIAASPDNDERQPQKKTVHAMNDSDRDNVIPLRELETPQQVLEDALKADLEDVVVSGIRKDGTNYLQFNGSGKLQTLIWLVFSAENSVHRILGNRRL